MPEMTSLKHIVGSLSLRVVALEQARPSEADALGSEDPCEVVQNTKFVQDFTEEIFSAAATVAVVRDPDYDNRSLVVSVPCHGSVEELVEKSDRWHRELPSIARELTQLYSLSIVPLDECD